MDKAKASIFLERESPLKLQLLFNMITELDLIYDNPAVWAHTHACTSFVTGKAGTSSIIYMATALAFLPLVKVHL